MNDDVYFVIDYIRNLTLPGQRREAIKKNVRKSLCIIRGVFEGGWPEELPKKKFKPRFSFDRLADY